jgi:hypothetical protein
MEMSRGEQLMLLGSDPTQFEIRGARLFIFGDVLGREMWRLDEKSNIAHADVLWPEIRDKHPGKTLEYDSGGTFHNLVFKYPGRRAREGFGQPPLGVPGEADDHLAR